MTDEELEEIEFDEYRGYHLVPRYEYADDGETAIDGFYVVEDSAGRPVGMFATRLQAMAFVDDELILTKIGA